MNTHTYLDIHDIYIYMYVYIYMYMHVLYMHTCM